jgi:hypothetical protein
MSGDGINQDNNLTFRKSIGKYFDGLEDYRCPESVKHRLTDILFFTICAVISSANDLKAVEMYAQNKQL